jgi:hypothetical protein
VLGLAPRSAAESSAEKARRWVATREPWAGAGGGGGRANGIVDRGHQGTGDRTRATGILALYNAGGLHELDVLHVVALQLAVVVLELDQVRLQREEDAPLLHHAVLDEQPPWWGWVLV